MVTCYIAIDSVGNWMVLKAEGPKKELNMLKKEQEKQYPGFVSFGSVLRCHYEYCKASKFYRFTMTEILFSVPTD